MIVHIYMYMYIGPYTECTLLVNFLYAYIYIYLYFHMCGLSAPSVFYSR